VLLCSRCLALGSGREGTDKRGGRERAGRERAGEEERDTVGSGEGLEVHERPVDSQLIWRVLVWHHV
jgi:hypothetical protein